jgi:hypothetical protein
MSLSWAFSKPSHMISCIRDQYSANLRNRILVARVSLRYIMHCVTATTCSGVRYSRSRFTCNSIQHSNIVIDNGYCYSGCLCYYCYSPSCTSAYSFKGNLFQYACVTLLLTVINGLHARKPLYHTTTAVTSASHLFVLLCRLLCATSHL